MTDNEIRKAFDILDKFEFFGGQRAGRELWFNKPTDIQDKDIGAFLRDLDFLKQFINRQKTEIERYEKENSENFNKWLLLDKRTKERYAELYEEAKVIVRAEAVKEFAERLKERTISFSSVVEQRKIIDNLVKEMVEE